MPDMQKEVYAQQVQENSAGLFTAGLPEKEAAAEFSRLEREESGIF